MSYIEISNISKSYKKHSVLTDISLVAEPGDCIGIVGANGCGKSTLLKILSGAISPNSGSIVYDGNPILDRKSLFSKYVGYVPQDNPLFDNLSTMDNLRLWYCDSNHNLKEDIESGIIKDFGIDKYLRTTVKNLSGGMKKRLSIACTVVRDPKILILDEPGASLDIVCKEDIKNYMKKHTEAGGIVIIASHEEGELSVCNKTFFMRNGVLSPLPENYSVSELMSKIEESND